jgi:hypothetical protein
MPFDDDTQTFTRIWTFANQFAAGEEADRADFDVALDDLADGLTDAVEYLLGEIAGISEENLYLGEYDEFPETQDGGAPLVDGNLILLDGLFYLWIDSAWASVGGNHGATETGLALFTAASIEAVREMLGLGSTALLSFNPSQIDGNMTFLDNVQAGFGTDADLTIKHNGTSGFIANGTGTLFIDSTSVAVRDPDDSLSTSFGISADEVSGSVLASTLEAEAGVANNKLMTPLSTRAAAAAVVFDLTDLALTDLNTITDGGFYYVQTTCTNSPDSAQSWFLEVMELAATEVQQRAYRHALDNGQLAIRQCLGGVWSDWHFVSARESSAVQALTSGAQVDFSSVPVYATEVMIHARALSASGAAELSLRLRAASAGTITTGYVGASSQIAASAASAAFAVTDRITVANLADAADTYTGLIRLVKNGNTNIWSVIADGRIAAAHCRTVGTVDLGVNGIVGFRLYLSAGSFDGSGSFYVDWKT